MKKRQSKKSTDKYITRLAEDLKAFREKEASGEKISARERRNIRARERRVIAKMKESASSLIEQANKTLSTLESKGIYTLAAQRVYDEIPVRGENEEIFSLKQANTYDEIVKEITIAKTFLNSPETTQLTGSREARNRRLKKKYGELEQSLKDKTYIEKGLIPTEEDAKAIFATYRRIEEYWASLIGKEGQRGVYGSDKLILYLIDVYNQGLDAELYGMQAMENFSLERTPEYRELFEERNKVTGISGLFTQKGKGYGRLAGLL